MRKLVIIILLSFSSPVVSQQGWYAINTGINSAVQDFSFYNPDFGAFLYNYQYCAITSNSGNTFQYNQIYDNQYAFFYNIYCLFPGVVHASGVYSYFSMPLGKVSIDYGVNWQNGEGAVLDAEIKGGKLFYGIGNVPSFVTEGFLRKIDITTGNNEVFLQGNEMIKEISFINENTGWVYGYYGSDTPPSIRKLYKTTNGCLSFNVVYTDTIPSMTDFKCLTFFNEQNGITLDNGLLKKTSDGGISWQQTGFSFNYIAFINANTGWGGGNGIHKTTNGGVSFEQQSSVTGIRKIQMLDSLNGYAHNYYSIYKTTTGGLTGIVNNNTEVTTFRLYQNYPNPFNPSTKITFDIPSKQLVSLKVYDISGKEIAQLVNSQMDAGSYTYEWNAEAFPSGVYFYTLDVGELKEMKKMLMMK